MSVRRRLLREMEIPLAGRKRWVSRTVNEKGPVRALSVTSHAAGKAQAFGSPWAWSSCTRCWNKAAKSIDGT